MNRALSTTTLPNDFGTTTFQTSPLDRVADTPNELYLEYVVPEPNAEQPKSLTIPEASTKASTDQLANNLLPIWRLSTPPEKENFVVLQKWIGYVVDVDREIFRARLSRITGEADDQDAEIYLTEVSPGDRSLLEPGAVFYWAIGYWDSASGTRSRVSRLRFRRRPLVDDYEIKIASSKATQLRDLFDDG
ncbi:MAG: hypothetical protein ACT4QE_11320 [Anaerolineales bacterium]